VAHWHSGFTSAPPGDEHCGETPAECLVILYYVFRAQTMLQYYYFILFGVETERNNKQHVTMSFFFNVYIIITA